MAFTRTWNAAYEAIPADANDLSEGANRIRDLKLDIRERTVIDHSWAGTVDDGEHKKVTFNVPLGADPANVANKGFLYTKDVSAKVELFWEDEDGNVVQLTSGGVLIGGTQVKVSSDDTTRNYLLSKLVAGTGITLTEQNPAGDENIKIDAATGVPDNYLTGLKLERDSGDPNHDIKINVGICDADTNDDTLDLTASIVKQLDFTWAVGSGAGGLDTGSSAINTWYHLWLIKRPDTGVVDALFSLSASSPTMPTNYTKKRRLGAVLTDASKNIIAFSQKGDDFLWVDPPLDIDVSNPGTAAVSRTLSVPLGIQVDAQINAFLADDSPVGTTIAYLSSPDVNDEVPSRTAAPLHTILVSGNNPQQFNYLTVRTNTSSQIRSRQDVSNADHRFLAVTLGWIDRRGRDG